MTKLQKLLGQIPPGHDVSHMYYINLHLKTAQLLFSE